MTRPSRAPTTPAFLRSGIGAGHYAPSGRTLTRTTSSNRLLVGGVAVLVGTTLALQIAVAARLGRPPLGPRVSIFEAITPEQFALALLATVAAGAALLGGGLVVLGAIGPKTGPTRPRADSH